MHYVQWSISLSATLSVDPSMFKRCGGADQVVVGFHSFSSIILLFWVATSLRSSLPVLARALAGFKLGQTPAEPFSIVHNVIRYFL